jgi:hypothetical protein
MVSNTGKTDRSLKSRTCHEFRVSMKKINFLICARCKWSYIWVFPSLEIFQSSDNVCRLFWKIIARLVRQSRITIANTLSNNHFLPQSLQLHNFCQSNHSESLPKKLSRSICQLYHLFDHTIASNPIRYATLSGWHNIQFNIVASPIISSQHGLTDSNNSLFTFVAPIPSISQLLWLCKTHLHFSISVHFVGHLFVWVSLQITNSSLKSGRVSASAN